jgi:type II secretory pathway pseudopilin PulG
MAIIDKPSDYFNTVLYTGNGGTQSITGLDFAPDWVWLKCRNRVEENVVFDVIRGATKKIYPNLTSAESTEVNTLTSFNSDGFSLGSAGLSNSSGDTFASWNWKANGTGVANTDGSISSTVSANTTSGFSIITFTGNGTAGATVAHGLSAIPKCILLKVYSSADAYDWRVYHASLGATKNMILNSTAAEATATNKWNDTEPTSSVFSLGDTLGTNESGSGIVAYCFADTSMSKMGSYTGNGNADGTFVYTGFKPAWFMLKKTNATDDWHIFDNKRNTSNVVDENLRANLSNAEFDTGVDLDFLSNGVKLRNTDDNGNGSGDTYIYMAFAENPFVTSTGVPATAR